MASSKDLYQRNKEDVKDGLGIVKSAAFEKLITFARAEFMHRFPSSEQCSGAQNFISILMDLPEESTEAPDWSDSGLKHDLTTPDRGERKP